MNSSQLMETNRLLLAFLLVLVGGFLFLEPAIGGVSAKKRWPFDIAGNYQFDTEQIKVTSSEARLRVKSNWFDKDWDHRQKVTIQSSQVPGNVTDFPVYLDLSDMNPNFFAESQPNGEDIVVTDHTGSQVPHEIVSIDSGANTGELWFKAPELSSSSDTHFFVFYGNPSATDQQDTEAVWSNNYDGVWHLGDDFKDASPRNNHGTNFGSVDTPGFIGNAQEFEASGGSLFPNGDSIQTQTAFGTRTATISAWINTTQTSNSSNNWESPGLFGVESAGDNDDVFWGYINQSGNIAVTAKGDANPAVSTTDISDGTFYHVVFTWDHNTGDVEVYVNGSLEDSNTAGTGEVTNSLLPDAIGVMLDDGGSPVHYDGIIDEFRFADNVIRSGDWIETQFNNQNSPSTFYSIGSEESDKWNEKGPTIINKTGVQYQTLDTFIETPGINHEGTLRYQISDDGSNWFWHNAGTWSTASDSSEVNSATAVDANLPSFDNDVGTGTFFFKAFLKSNGLNRSTLDEIELGYETRSETRGVTPSAYSGSNACWQNADAIFKSDDNYDTADMDVTDPCSQALTDLISVYPKLEEFRVSSLGSSTRQTVLLFYRWWRSVSIVVLPLQQVKVGFPTTQSITTGFKPDYLRTIVQSRNTSINEENQDYGMGHGWKATELQ